MLISIQDNSYTTDDNSVIVKYNYYSKPNLYLSMCETVKSSILGTNLIEIKVCQSYKSAPNYLGNEYYSYKLMRFMDLNIKRSYYIQTIRTEFKDSRATIMYSYDFNS